MWDDPIMKLVADSRGRLTAAELFRPGTAYDATQLADGKILVVELVAREVPEISLRFHADGSFECPVLMTREQIRAAIRADRDAL
jgi:hypothetical protein